MYPILYDKNTNTKLAILDNIIDDSASITRSINREFTFTFEAHEKEMKSEFFESETYVAIDDKLFDLKSVETDHNIKVIYSIDCEHVFYRLIDYELEYYTFDGTPTQIMNDILFGTEFTLGTIDFTEILTFAVYQSTNKMDLIIQLANLLGGEIDFHNFEISIKNTIGSNNGFEIRFGKNLKGIKKILDKRDNKISYSVDLLALKNSETYLENGLSGLEIIEEGDTVRIFDDVIGIDVVNRIVKRTYNPLFEKNVELEIANFIELMTDKVTQIQRDTLIKSETYYGTRISPDSGFESIRNDKMARGVFNADLFALQSGDGTGDNWVNKLYFDPVEGKYIFDGTLTAAAIEAIKATIDIVISETTITQTLAAQTGTIAELTVDSIETSDKVQKYLVSDTSDVDYWRGQDQFIKFITATTDGLSTEQVVDRNGMPLYWLDDTYEGVSQDVTSYPVLQYVYTELEKMKIQFEDVNGVQVPSIVMGAGAGVVGAPDFGKGFIYEPLPVK
ncbi:MAG: phage tail protein [Vallitaleaceae bacterium]|nr:phage tail protein [Vallitaleaceae bacterium]